MKIALLGYGKMGKEIEQTALERNHEIVLIIDIDTIQKFTSENLKNADVAIDFSTPESAYSNIIKCFEADIPVVSGTTGWLNRFEEILNYCEKNRKTFFYASNYSIGVNIFFEINRKLARLMNNFPEYNPSIKEIHHIHKLDAPSGTAITLANDTIKELSRKTHWALDSENNPQTIAISALRQNEVPGTHHVFYNSTIDSVEIIHSAKSRKGFATGAVLAAEFVKDKTGYYTMTDLMNHLA